VAISTDGPTLASAQRNMSGELWVGPANAPDKVHQVTTGRLDGNQGGLSFAPDDQLVYVGILAEKWDLFMAGPDGTNVRQLTFDRTFHASPTVCSHGSVIVYYSDSGGVEHLWKLDIQTGSATQIPNTAGGLIPYCTADGQSIVYWEQAEGETSYVYKIPFSGGTPVRISDRVAVSPPFLSLDGQHVLFATPFKNGGIGGAVFSVGSGSLVKEITVPDTFDVSASVLCWMPDNRSIAYPDLRTGVPNLWSQQVIGTGPQKQLTHFPSGKIWGCAFSPDGKYVAISHGSRQSDAVLFTKPNSATAGQ
jgi:Tol biopolymer transport system component